MTFERVYRMTKPYATDLQRKYTVKTEDWTEAPADSTGNSDTPKKKAPRKPRPSEVAAKKAKAAAKKKKVAPKRKRPAPKKKAKAKRPKATRKPVKRAKTKRKNNRPLVRVERLDMRISKAEKAWLEKASRKRGATITEVVLDVLAKAVKRSR